MHRCIWSSGRCSWTQRLQTLNPNAHGQCPIWTIKTCSAFSSVQRFFCWVTEKSLQHLVYRDSSVTTEWIHSQPQLSCGSFGVAWHLTLFLPHKLSHRNQTLDITFYRHWAISIQTFQKPTEPSLPSKSGLRLSCFILFNILPNCSNHF